MKITNALWQINMEYRDITGVPFSDRSRAINTAIKSLAEWARIKNMHPQTIWSRIRLGWNVDDAIEKPIMSKGEKNKC